MLVSWLTVWLAWAPSFVYFGMLWNAVECLTDPQFASKSRTARTAFWSDLAKLYSYPMLLRAVLQYIWLGATWTRMLVFWEFCDLYLGRANITIAVSCHLDSCINVFKPRSPAFVVHIRLKMTKATALYEPHAKTGPFRHKKLQGYMLWTVLGILAVCVP